MDKDRPKGNSPIRGYKPAVNPKPKAHLSYMGGKNRQSDWLKMYMPFTKDINTYTEVFGGMFWLYLKQHISQVKQYKTVVYNDFNPINSNFFNSLSKSFDEVLEESLKIDFQKKNRFKTGDKTDPKYKLFFNQFQDDLFNIPYTYDEDKPDVERCVKLAYLLSNVWSGLNPETSSFVDLKHNSDSKYKGFINKLLKGTHKDHIDHITNIECLDFENHIKKYDSIDTFFYIDPPYYNTENYYALEDNFTNKDHKRLVELIKTIEGKFMLSYYDFPELKEWFPKDMYRWESKEYNKASSNTKGEKGTKGEELIIMNY